MEYEHVERKSTGVAKAGLTLGIIGTSLAGLLAANGGLNVGSLGGILGKGATADAESRVSTLEAYVAELKSMRYTDLVGIDLYKNIVETAKEEDAKIREVQNQMIGYVIDLDKRTALNTQAQELNRAYDNMARNYEMTILNNKIDCCCEKAAMQTCFNKQLSEGADQSIINFIKSNYIPGTLYLPSSSITPPVALA
jgi:hypothetical protein